MQLMLLRLAVDLVLVVAVEELSGAVLPSLHLMVDRYGQEIQMHRNQQVHQWMI
jgi:hypothetical protein